MKNQEVPGPIPGPNPKDVRLFAAAFVVCLFVTVVFRLFFAPEARTSFDSGSIRNQEVSLTGSVIPPVGADNPGEIFPIEDVSPKESAPPEEPKFPESILGTGKRRAIPSRLSFSFRPNTAKPDEKIFSLLRENLIARPFQDKVLPLSIMVDADRVEPRGQLTGDQITLSDSIGSD